MTMLTHTRGPNEQAPYSTANRGTVRARAARLAMLKRIGKGALVALVAGGAVAGIIALKTIIYLSRF
jgi:hypothetical protein